MLSLTNESYAQIKNNISFNDLIRKIRNHETFEITYNPSKTAAVVNTEVSLPVYINFKKKQTYVISDHWPGFVSTVWLNDTVAHIHGSCGAGCGKSIIFIAPSTIVSCAMYQYRIENLDERNPPDYMSNRPLLIDVKKGIYVCYDEVDNIQIFPLLKYPTIRPPVGYFTEKAELHKNQLVIRYENGHGKTKDVFYKMKKIFN